VTTDHRPHVVRLTGGWQMPSLEKSGTLKRLLLGGWQINATTFLRSGLTVPMPDNVDLIGDPVLKHPTTARWFNTCTLTAAGARQNCASESEQPAFRIRAENALDTTGAQRADQHRHVVLQDGAAARPFQFPASSGNVQRAQQGSVGQSEYHDHVGAVRLGDGDAAERSALRAARVPLLVLGARFVDEPLLAQVE
jgi:hypothetical protein